MGYLREQSPVFLFSFQIKLQTNGFHASEPMTLMRVSCWSFTMVMKWQRHTWKPWELRKQSLWLVRAPGRSLGQGTLGLNSFLSFSSCKIIMVPIFDTPPPPVYTKHFTDIISFNWHANPVKYYSLHFTDKETLLVSEGAGIRTQAACLWMQAHNHHAYHLSLESLRLTWDSVPSIEAYLMQLAILGSFK